MCVVKGDYNSLWAMGVGVGAGRLLEVGGIQSSILDASPL